MAEANRYMAESWFTAMPDADPIVPTDQQYDKDKYACTAFRDISPIAPTRERARATFSAASRP